MNAMLKMKIKKQWWSNLPLYLIAGGNGATGAIAGGVAAGAALLFAAPAIAFAWWRRRKPQEFFFDVPGEQSKKNGYNSFWTYLKNI